MKVCILVYQYAHNYKYADMQADVEAGAALAPEVRAPSPGDIAAAREPQADAFAAGTSLQPRSCAMPCARNGGAATAVVSSRDVRRIVALLSPASADEINIIAADALRALTSGANEGNGTSNSAA